MDSSADSKSSDHSHLPLLSSSAVASRTNPHSKRSSSATAEGNSTAEFHSREEFSNSHEDAATAAVPGAPPVVGCLPPLPIKGALAMPMSDPLRASRALNDGEKRRHNETSEVGHPKCRERKKDDMEPCDSPTANSLLSSVVVAGGRAASSDDPLLSSPPATAQQSPPSPLRCMTAAPSPPCDAVAPTRDGDTVLSNDNTISTETASTTKSTTGAVMDAQGPAAPPVYPTYNVHPVFRRTAHPFFRRDIPSRIGRQAASNNSSMNICEGNFLSLSVLHSRLTQEIATPMRSIQTSSTAFTTDGTPRRGIRFAQQLAQRVSYTRNTGGGGDTTKSESASMEHPDPMEILFSTHSTEYSSSSSLRRPPPPPPQPMENPLNVHKVCPNPPLNSAADVPAQPCALLPSSLMMACDASLSLKAAPPSGSRRPQQLPPPAGRWESLASFTSGKFAQSAASPWRTPPSNATHRAPATRFTLVPTAAILGTLPTRSQQSPLQKSSGYSRCDIRRGRWIINITSEECVARAALEEEESYEAIRTLPASCGVWRSYIDPALSDSDDALGYCMLEHASTAEHETPTRIGMPDLNRNDFGHAGFLSGNDAERDVDEPLSDELAHASGCFQYERLTADAATVHPAFLAAAKRLTLLEEICRADIVKAEATAFCEGVYRRFVYAHRVMVVGTLPLERFLRRWIGFYRARKVLHTRQLARLYATECNARADLIASSRSLAGRHACMVAAVVEEEHYYRTHLELLQTQNQAWTGVVSLRLREHVELFLLLYGGTMRHTRVCARVQSTTLFRGLALTEEATRSAMETEEDLEWRRIPTIMQLRWTVVSEEPRARAQLLQAEATRRLDLTQVIYALRVHYTKRDVEFQEFDERQQWSDVWKQSIACRDEAAVTTTEL
ncbi:hypothetical protein ABL78_3578 [Leptomonas seymouri]|uniref:Uncharacterized protein n=1 Tax=Leptomonas seymouri TaxID=5684 RepID=A0A0N0P6M4_LEPSE|nr:hypothetical protein ABL78_3578 [Leptomonas seymouri]|eukprot:KPI87337.1 hypothetical protein ABL78_3578 [Leptomonas seymouri]